MPAILNDITTDLDDPPRFVLQQDGPGHFDPATRAAHAGAYADLSGLRLEQPPAAVFERAKRLCGDSGWRIVAADAASETGAAQIEAVATTRLLRFRDDIAIRIRADGEGALVDMRSKSRVGKGDLGTNARRIRKFLSRLPAA